MMSNRLLQQYGVAAPSSLTPVVHPEDVQPNEMGRRGTQRAPPNIAVTTISPGGSMGIRGGYRGSPYRGGTFTQYAVRGNSSWRDHGRGRGSSRGVTMPHNGDHYRYQNASAARPSSFKQPFVQWGRQESTAAWKSSASTSTSQSSAATVSSVNITSSCHSVRSFAAKTDTQTAIHQKSRNIPVVNHLSLPPKPITDFLGHRRDRPQLDRPLPVKHSLSPVQMKPEQNYPHTPESSSITIEPTSPVYKPMPHWCIRSRSPSPLLPPVPLKRRKITPDSYNPMLTTEVIDTTLREIQYSLITDTELARRIIVGDPVNIPLPETGCQSSQMSITSAPARPAQKLPLTPPESTISVTIKQEPAPVEMKSGDRPARELPSALPKSTVAVKRAPSLVRVKSEDKCSVKGELQSPPPPESSQPVRKLITESTNYYPIPDKCKKSNTDFANNRRSYFVKKEKELRQLGLKKTKAFWRDDGLVIEWSSSMPVWSDTLKPDITDLATAIKRANEINSMCMFKSPKAKRIKCASTTSPTDSITRNSANHRVDKSIAIRDDNRGVAVDDAKRRPPNTLKETKSPPLSKGTTSSDSYDMKLTDMLSSSSAKRKRMEPAGIDDASPSGLTIEVIDDVESVCKKGEPARKKIRKHWNAKIPANEPHLSDNAAPRASGQLPAETISRRLPLPTRLHQAQSVTASADVTPFTVPDPSAALPSQGWRTVTNKDSSTSRLMFKPSNPRKSQGATDKTLETTSTETQDRTSGSWDYISNEAKIARGSGRNDLPPSGWTYARDKHSMSSVSSQLSAPSMNARPMSQVHMHSRTDASRYNSRTFLSATHKV